MTSLYSRRDFGKVGLAALPASRLLAQKVAGVQLGICTYSFRSMPRTGQDSVDDVIKAMKECGGTICELFSPQLEPENPMMAAGNRGPQTPRPRQDSPEAKKYRDDVRSWRLNTPAEHFRTIRKKFDDAGIEIYAYTLNFRNDFTDPELDKCFEQAKALGAKTIASSTQLTVAPRLASFAEKHKIYVALHGHANTADPNEFSSPETFAKALGMSDWFRINLDIGHFTAGGFDPVSYIDENHAKITHLHMKDRKKNNGPNEPFGEGETPIKQVLTLLKDKHYPLPALIEYEYKGTGTPVEEVKRCLDYERAALKS